MLYKELLEYLLRSKKLHFPKINLENFTYFLRLNIRLFLVYRFLRPQWPSAASHILPDWWLDNRTSPWQQGCYLYLSSITPSLYLNVEVGFHLCHFGVQTRKHSDMKSILKIDTLLDFLDSGIKENCISSLHQRTDSF